MLLKTWIRNVVDADELSVPETRVAVVRGVADVIVGAACPSLADPTSTMPVAAFEDIELERMVLPTPERTSTPAPPLSVMVFAAPAAVPPMVLLEAPPSIATPSSELPSWLGAARVGADEVAFDEVAGRARAAQVDRRRYCPR